MEQEQKRIDYTVKELMDRLAADPSWEEDPAIRQGIVIGVQISLMTA